jgi:hypothetical protein
MPAADRVGPYGPAASWMESAPMSLAASQRRDQRRRLVLSWNRSASAPSTSLPETRRQADYSPEALPEHQPSLATLLPTGLGGFALAAAGLLALLAAAVGVGLWEAVANGPVFGRGASRFAATLATVRRCLDVRSLLSLGGWLAQVSLVIATVTALIVRLMRRHRRDDYRGRYRAWGWLAGLFALTACAGQVPLGDLFSAFASEATGVVIGPNGMGWWALLAGLLYAAVGLWAVLPLHERAATGIWLSLCFAAWAAAAACDWVGHGQELPEPALQAAVGNACWMAGGVLAAIAMLAAARSVLREVQGLPARRAAGKPSTAADVASNTRKAAATAASESDDEADAVATRRNEDDDTRGQRQGHTVFVDAADASEADDDLEQSGRHLSKAERKRLRKLSRMSRAA